MDLFTSEEYVTGKYPEYGGLLSKAQYLVPLGEETNGFCFAISPSFIEKFGLFSHSIIIAMGCSSLKVNCYGMAQAFINKGAKAYVGWTEVVLPTHTDNDTLVFLEMFLGNNETLSRDTTVTSDHTYLDPNTHEEVTTRMEFYPFSAMNLKIFDLIAETETKASIMFNCFEVFPFLIIKPYLSLGTSTYSYQGRLNKSSAPNINRSMLLQQVVRLKLMLLKYQLRILAFCL